MRSVTMLLPALPLAACAQPIDQQLQAVANANGLVDMSSGKPVSEEPRLSPGATSADLELKAGPRQLLRRGHAQPF